MILKNIYKRKDFVKQYEFLGGNEGGTGSGNGFANNAALQETLLGQILDGMFKSISWLWRKSKENFVINRLKARLSNELLRGVILYCFENNINILTGKKIDSVEKGEGEDKSQDQAVKTGQEEDQTDEQDSVQDQSVQAGQEEVEDNPAEIRAVNAGEEQKALPEHKDDFEIIKKDIQNIDKYSMDDIEDLSRLNVAMRLELAKRLFGIKIDVTKVVEINNIEDFEDKINDMLSFLKSNVPNYDKMKDIQKKNVRNIYMNYIISKNMLNKVKQKATTESYKLNEEFESAPMSDPRAGSDPKSKKLSTNVTVSSILTKKDKEKYKEHDEEIKANISEINLAEIEKKIDELQSKTEVSKYVNPENLKTIELTADNLFLPSKTSLYKKPEVGEKSLEKQKLQNNWNKEISKIYASFSDIMNISYVDIRKEYRTELEKKVGPKVINERDKFIHYTNTNKAVDSLVKYKILDPKKVKFSELKGLYSYFSFTCKNLSYISTMSSIISITTKEPDCYLLKINNTFSSIDFDEQKFESNFKLFKNQFAMKPTYNVYFLFRNPKISSATYTNKMLLFNEDPVNKKLYLCKFKEGDSIIESVDIEDNIDDEKIKNWIVPIKIDDMRLFDVSKGRMKPELKKIFNFDADYSSPFITPPFYDRLSDKIIEIKNKMKTD